MGTESCHSYESNAHPYTKLIRKIEISNPLAYSISPDNDCAAVGNIIRNINHPTLKMILPIQANRVCYCRWSQSDLELLVCTGNHEYIFHRDNLKSMKWKKESVYTDKWYDACFASNGDLYCMTMKPGDENNKSGICHMFISYVHVQDFQIKHLSYLTEYSEYSPVDTSDDCFMLPYAKGGILISPNVYGQYILDSDGRVSHPYPSLHIQEQGPYDTFSGPIPGKWYCHAAQYTKPEFAENIQMWQSTSLFLDSIDGQHVRLGWNKQVRIERMLSTNNGYIWVTFVDDGIRDMDHTYLYEYKIEGLR